MKALAHMTIIGVTMIIIFTAGLYIYTSSLPTAQERIDEFEKEMEQEIVLEYNIKDPNLDFFYDRDNK